MAEPNVLVNLRDVSRGLPPGTLREGMLLRSDAPLDDDLEPSATVWPPTTVIDLRHPSEAGETHPFEAWARVHRISLVDPTVPPPPGPEKGDGLRAFYSALFTPAASAGMAAAIGLIAEAEGPTLVHCVAGKDRTGVTIALALRLVGVPREAVVEEYLLTNRIAPDLVLRLSRHYERMPLRRETRPVTVSSVHAPRTLIEEAMQRWDTHPHGTEGWFRDAGGEPNAIRRLAERLVR